MSGYIDRIVEDVAQAMYESSEAYREADRRVEWEDLEGTIRSDVTHQDAWLKLARAAIGAYIPHMLARDLKVGHRDLIPTPVAWASPIGYENEETTFFLSDGTSARVRGHAYMMIERDASIGPGSEIRHHTWTRDELPEIRREDLSGV